jgi:predicted negative regulator of RcsB-dependent stress response
MTEHLSEEEQVEALKKWWKENGNAVIIGVVIGLSGVIGVRYWFSYQENRNVSASDVYNQYVTALNKKDAEGSKKIAAGLREKFAGTAYAALTALSSAKQDADAGKLADAEQQLRWALENPGHESIALIARQRLAGVLTAEGKLDEALTLLDKIKNETFDPRYALIRGDIYRKQGKLEKAREAYQLALTDTTLTGKQREFVEMKLGELPELPKQDSKK